MAKTYPDAVYEPNVSGCLYKGGRVKNGPPDKYGCIVGQAMTNVGLEYEEHHCTIGAIDVGSSSFAKLLNRPHFNSHINSDSSYDIGFIDIVQEQQDIGKTWGEALNYAWNQFPDGPNH